MSELYLHNKPIESLFQLLGEDENDITYSIGWALHRSKAFLRLFLKETLRAQADIMQAAMAAVVCCKSPLKLNLGKSSLQRSICRQVTFGTWHNGVERIPTMAVCSGKFEWTEK